MKSMHPTDRPEKIHLSSAMEEMFFRAPLKKRQLEALKERCESYQVGTPHRWKGDIYPAYSQYFGFLTALKVKAALSELESYGYLDVFDRKPMKVIDFGAGTLGASLGALDFLSSTKRKIDSLEAYDVDDAPVRWACETFSSFLPKNFEILKSPPTASSDGTLFIAVDVLNEMGLMTETPQADSAWFQTLNHWASSLSESNILLLIEPANKTINQRFLKMRNDLSRTASILLPCTHSMHCPALAADEWCHEDRYYKAPSVYWNLVHSLGFSREFLSFSLLVLGGQKSRFSDRHARVVSRNLKSKGRCDKWMCGAGKRWKASLLLRHENEQNVSYFQSRRGDILDCDSTGLRPPD